MHGLLPLLHLLLAGLPELGLGQVLLQALEYPPLACADPMMQQSVSGLVLSTDGFYHLQLLHACRSLLSLNTPHHMRATLEHMDLSTKLHIQQGIETMLRRLKWCSGLGHVTKEGGGCAPGLTSLQKPVISPEQSLLSLGRRRMSRDCRILSLSSSRRQLSVRPSLLSHKHVCTRPSPATLAPVALLPANSASGKMPRLQAAALLPEVQQWTSG